MSHTDSERWILHADMDAFYASVEQRDFPELRGLPVVVGGRSKRGVVAAASYESRRFGIRSAMPMRDALRRCPDLICQTPRMSEYKTASDQIFSIFLSFTPIVEGLSLDEAFLDISASISLFGPPEQIGQELKRRVRSQTGLTISVGIAPNKLVAKIASDLDKPDGLVVVRKHIVKSTLDPLPVRVVPGIGRKTLERLQRVGISTVGELRVAPRASLESVFGKMADHMRGRAAGEDSRAVECVRTDKSISAEETFANDTDDRPELAKELLSLSERTAARVRSKDLLAETLQLKIRRADFRTFTRQMKLAPATNHTDAIYHGALQLLGLWLSENEGAKIRLLGVGCADFVPSSQIEMFDTTSEPQGGTLDRAVDSIRERFGGGALTRARTLDHDER